MQMRREQFDNGIDSTKLPYSMAIEQTRDTAACVNMK